MTPAERQAVLEKLRPYIEAEVRKAKEQQRLTPKPTFQDLLTLATTEGKSTAETAFNLANFTDKTGAIRSFKAREREAAGVRDTAAPDLFSARPVSGTAPPEAITQAGDGDGDGLPDDFENQVADAFTPIYGVSGGGEVDGFASFGNFVPQTVQQVFGSIPPRSDFRVQPLGFATDVNGTQFGFLRIDYLTLWNHDSGLPSNGPTCALSFVGLDVVIQQVSSHDIDNERSVVLVGAPTGGTGRFNTDPNAYGGFSFYTAAHEGTFFDQSRFLDFSPAVPANNHINLALSLSKHSTYTFDPNFFPITPAAVIVGTLNEIDFLFNTGQISETTWFAFRAAAEDVFFACIVERFSNQGGFFAQTRTNVGEPNAPINNSGYIQDRELNDKLTRPVF